MYKKTSADVMEQKNFCFCLIIALTMIYPVCNLGNAYGMPPFSRYSFYDGNIDEQVDSSIDAQGNPTAAGDFPINILSGTYLSDGNQLNATLWLSDPINEDRHREYFDSDLNYVMDIYGVDPEDRTTIDILYSVIIYPEEDGSWTKRIIEYEPGAELPQKGIKVDDIDTAYKILKIYPNTTGFFENNNWYVTINLPLNDIGNPADIAIGFRANIEKDGNLIDDWTNSYDAPSRRNEREFKWPTALQVRAGETATGEVLIHNLQLATLGNITLRQNAITDNYTLEFQPNRIEYPLNGTLSSNFEITLSPNVMEGLLPVQVNVTATTIENINSSLIETFYVTVLPPLPELDRLVGSFNEFLVDTFAIYWIPFGISGVFGLWLSRKIDRGRLPKEFLEQLRTKDILTVNASVVAGVLIFLTVGGTELFGSGAIIHISILTASIVYPFAISAIRVLITGDPVSGIKFTIPGFIFLMVSVVLIALLLNQNPQNT